MSDNFLSEIDEAVSGIPDDTQQSVSNPQENINTSNNDSGSTDEDVYNSLGIETEEPSTKITPKQDQAKEGEKEPEKEDENTQNSPTPKKEVEDKVEKAKAKDRNKNTSNSALDRFYKEDDKGNFVTASGQVLIPAGPGRDAFESIRKEGRSFREHAIKANGDLQQLTEITRELNTKYQDLLKNPEKDHYKHYNVDEKIFNQAIDLAQNYQNNPIEAIKKLLTQAAASGINIKELGTQITADPATIRSVVEETINNSQKPVVEEPSEEQRKAEIETEIAVFFYRNPDAKQHEDKLAKIIQAYPNVSLEKAWNEYQLYLAKQEPVAEDEEDTTVINTITESTPKTSQPVAKQNPARPATTVSTPSQTQPNYATMSFDEIAKSVKQDYN